MLPLLLQALLAALLHGPTKYILILNEHKISNCESQNNHPLPKITHIGFARQGPEKDP